MRTTMDSITKRQLRLWTCLREIFPEGERLRDFERSIADRSMLDEKQFIVDLCRDVFHLGEGDASVVLALLVDDGQMG